MIKLHQITNQASTYWRSLVSVYLDAFPIDEQRPIEDIARLIAHDQRFVAYALTDTAGGFIGMLTTWYFEEFVYIEHFAIVPTLRSRGYGGEALQAFMRAQSKPVILEAEPPTDELTCRRIRFYERCGLTLYDYPYTQPAYTSESKPVTLRLMGTLDTTATPLAQVSATLHREVYGV